MIPFEQHRGTSAARAAPPLRAVASPPEPAPRDDRGFAQAFVDLEEAIAELRGMALAVEMVVTQTVSERGADRGCVLSEDRADALECAVSRLGEMALALNRTYAAAWPRVA